MLRNFSKAKTNGSYNFKISLPRLWPTGPLKSQCQKLQTDEVWREFLEEGLRNGPQKYSKKTRISEPHFSAPHYNSWQFVIFCNIEFRKNKVEIGTVTLVIILTVPTTRGISNLFFGGKVHNLVKKFKPAKILSKFCLSLS